MNVSFFEAAKRGNNSLTRYLITLLAVILAVFIGQIPLGLVMLYAIRKDGISQNEIDQILQYLDFSTLNIPQGVMLFLVLLSFAMGLLALYLSIRFLHNKRFTDVLSGRKQLDWRRIGFAFGFWIVLTVLLELILYMIHPDQYIFQFEWKAFAYLLPVALIMLPLQTSFEEVLFRAYLMQGIGLATAYRWIALLATSIMFGALHFTNPEVDQFGIGMMMSYYIGFGLLMGVCTLMDNGAELALGAHAATNIYGATIVSFSGSVLKTPSIFRVEELDVKLMLVIALISGILFLFTVARIYRWSNWSKLWRKID